MASGVPHPQPTPRLPAQVLDCYTEQASTQGSFSRPPSQDLRCQGVDSTWSGGRLPAPRHALHPPPPTAFLPGVSHSPAKGRPRSSPNDTCPAEYPPQAKRWGRAAGPPCPPPHRPWKRGESSQPRAHPVCLRVGAAISSPTSISLVPTRANYRVNHCARGSGRVKGKGQWRGKARPKQPCWPQTG